MRVVKRMVEGRMIEQEEEKSYDFSAINQKTKNTLSSFGDGMWEGIKYCSKLGIIFIIVVYLFTLILCGK
jgi:hypothetical protein